MKILAVVMFLQGCAFDQPMMVAYPQMEHRYGHTYYGIEMKGTTR